MQSEGSWRVKQAILSPTWHKGRARDVVSSGLAHHGLIFDHPTGHPCHLMKLTRKVWGCLVKIQDSCIHLCIPIHIWMQPSWILTKQPNKRNGPSLHLDAGKHQKRS